MLDDHRFSIGRVVVYRHPNPTMPRRAYGHKGPERTMGIIISVEAVEREWEYTIQNLRSRETIRVAEREIIFGASVEYQEFREAARMPSAGADRVSGQIVAEALHRALTESVVANYLRSSVHDLIKAEKAEEISRREGRDLPIDAGDYIRIRGDLRRETRPFHHLYAKVLSVEPSDLDTIGPTGPGRVRRYRARKRYLVRAENHEELSIYDPEVKVFYTSHGGRIILNWRAATFLAEAFGDECPYSVEFDYVQHHVYTRKELRGMHVDKLRDLLSTILYVKGHMGWRDYEDRHRLFRGVSQGFLIDTILASSRFDMRRNRLMSADEIQRKLQDRERLKKLLG